MYQMHSAIVSKLTVFHKPKTKRINTDPLKKLTDTTNIFCLCLCADYFCL